MPLEKPSVSGRYPCKPDRHDVQDQRRTIYCRWDWYRTHAWVRLLARASANNVSASRFARETRLLDLKGLPFLTEPAKKHRLFCYILPQVARAMRSCYSAGEASCGVCPIA